MFVLVLLLHLIALFLTFSRSAWLGAILALALVVWWQYRQSLLVALKRFWPLAAGLAVVVLVCFFAARDTAMFQRYLVHSDPSEQVADLDSNDLHVMLARQGLAGIADRPLGHGPGTAGLVSIQNPAGGQLTENYYIQIGYEIGVAGLALFIALNIWLYLKIWRRGDYVAIVLCASFWGYVLMNMLLHTWSNEAVAAQFWLLTGLALTGVKAAKPIK